MIGQISMEGLIQFLQNVPTPLATILLGAVPLAEISGALPAALFVWKLPWPIAYMCAVFGNMLPVAPVFFGLEFVRGWLFKLWPKLGKLIDAWIERARQKMHGKYEQYGFWALFLFTAIPFPLTGVYTAATAAIALRIPFKKTLLSLLLGVMASGALILITILTGEMIIG